MPAKKIVNTADIRNLIKIDPVFELIRNLYGQPPNWQREPGFISLSRIILEQQVSLASANAHYLKLRDHLKLFTPGNILTLSDTAMRECQISRQKAAYLRGLSALLLQQPDFLEQVAVLPVELARNKLISVKGIGRWTSDVYLLFCLQSKDIFPPGDIALIRTVTELKNVSAPEVNAIAERWSPYRSLAAFFCWHYYLSRRGRTAAF